MVGKFLLLVLIIAVVWWLAKGFRKGNAAGAPPAGEPERMVHCEHCGLYLPQGEAVREGDRFFCCPEHQRLAG